MKQEILKEFEEKFKPIKEYPHLTDASIGHIRLFLSDALDRQEKEINHKWQYHLAYLTNEDVATPEGVRKRVMSKFEAHQKVLEEWSVYEAQLQQQLKEIK